MPIIVLAGEEEFELTRRLDNLRNELLEPDWADLNFTVLRNNPGPGQICNAATSLPFGPGNRVVLVDQCSLFTKSRKGRAAPDKFGTSQVEAESAKAGRRGTPESTDRETSTRETSTDAKDSLKLFEQSLANIHPQTYLIFSCPYNFDSSLKYSKVVEKYAGIEEFPKPRYWPGSSNATLENWCRKEAHRHGATIENEAVSYLLESTEANLRSISSEIEKAAIFLMPETKITLDVVSQLSAHYSHAFSLLDHWARGNHRLALNDTVELVSRRSGIPLIALLNTSLSKWINIKALVEKRIAPADLARQLNMKPFVLNLEMSRIRSLPLAYLVKKRIELTRLEALVKTGQMPDHHALAVFVAT